MRITKSDIEASDKALDEDILAVFDPCLYELRAAIVQEWYEETEKEVDVWLIKFGLVPPYRKGNYEPI